jgi:hypothetical protein
MPLGIMQTHGHTTSEPARSVIDADFKPCSGLWKDALPKQQGHVWRQPKGPGEGPEDRIRRSFPWGRAFSWFGLDEGLGWKKPIGEGIEISDSLEKADMVDPLYQVDHISAIPTPCETTPPVSIEVHHEGGRVVSVVDGARTKEPVATAFHCAEQTASLQN